MALLYNDATPDALVWDAPSSLENLLVPPITLMCWAYNDDTTVQGNTLWVGDKDSNTSYARLRINGATGGDPLNYMVNQGGASLTIATTNGTTVNQWHHLVGGSGSQTNHFAVLDANFASFGVSTTDEGAFLSGADRIGIGRHLGSTPTNAFSGGIGPCAIWRINLTFTEIQAAYCGVDWRTIQSSKLWFYFDPRKPGYYRDEVYGRVLSLSSGAPVQALDRPLWRPTRTRRCVWAFKRPSANQIVSVGQATETETSQAITARKTITLGQPAETDLAQVVTRVKRVTLGQPAESTTVQTVTPRRTYTLGFPSETDAAQTVRPAKGHVLGQPASTETAQTVSWSPKKRLAAQTTETDLSQAVTARRRYTLGQPSETDLAQAITWSPKVRLVGRATETDAPQGIFSGEVVELGLNTVTEVSHPLTVGKRITLGQPTETALSQAVAHTKLRLVDQCVETDLAQTILRNPQRIIVFQSLETTLAHELIVRGGRSPFDAPEIVRATGGIRIHRTVRGQAVTTVEH